ncbi:MAG TPA: peptidylprolyl isomerase [Pirellulales bacterium]|nr:peptidylprolyl isomerase [Pirellulales bacterium]
MALIVLGVCGCNKTADSGSPAAVATMEAKAPAAQPGTTTAPSGAAVKARPVDNVRAMLARGDDLHPIVVLHTSMGDMVLRLDAERAPRTVYNFMSYAASGHYNDTIFHQVEAGYAVLGGGYTAEFDEKPVRYPIHNEAAPGMKNRRGTIAMAHQPSDADSATCQFFINLSDNSSLDCQSDDPKQRGYCVFGEVIEGLQVLEKISQVKVHSVKQFPSVPVQSVMIRAVTRLR